MAASVDDNMSRRNLFPESWVRIQEVSKSFFFPFVFVFFSFFFLHRISHPLRNASRKKQEQEIQRRLSTAMQVVKYIMFLPYLFLFPSSLTPQFAPLPQRIQKLAAARYRIKIIHSNANSQMSFSFLFLCCNPLTSHPSPQHTKHNPRNHSKTATSLPKIGSSKKPTQNHLQQRKWSDVILVLFLRCNSLPPHPSPKTNTSREVKSKSLNSINSKRLKSPFSIPSPIHLTVIRQ